MEEKLRRGASCESVEVFKGLGHPTLVGCVSVALRAEGLSLQGEGERGYLVLNQYSTESLGWPKGGGFGGCPLACLGVSLLGVSQGSQLGK